MNIDVIIPALNEHENITALLDAMPRKLLGRIIVVDNGSTDNTADLALQAGATVIIEPRLGYGSACLAGIAELAQLPVSPSIIAFIDADLADDPQLLPSICEPIISGHADMVIASRRKLALPGALTTTQRFGNWLACFLIRLCTGRRYHDLGPMRAIRWDCLQNLAMADTTWGWTVEMQYKAAVHGLRSQDIHVPYRPRRAGKSKISGTILGSIKAGYKILATIAWLRLTCRAPSETPTKTRNRQKT